MPTEVPEEYLYGALSSIYKFIGRLFAGEREGVGHGEKATAYG